MTDHICFAHANGFPSASYRKLFDALGEPYRVHALEKVGHDPRFPVDANWRSLVLQLIDFIESSIGHPVIGVGHSLGGVLTFMAVLQRPDLFRAFVLLDPPAYVGLSAWLIRLAKGHPLIDRITPAGKTLGRRSVWPSREAAYASLKDKSLFRRFDPDCLRDYIRYGTEETDEGVRLIYQPRIEVAIFRNIPHDLDRRAPVGVPGAIVCGQATDTARPAAMRRLARRHRLGLSELPGGHMFPLENPLPTAERLRSLLPELLARAGTARRSQPDRRAAGIDPARP